VGYDFSRFTSQSFERFSQALVTKKFGPGVHVYGDGPDGAREASFEGRLDIQTTGTVWDGYTVVQTKYRQTPRGGADDAGWLERELKKEFSKFLDTRRNLKKPEFYLIITNVVLTPAASRLTSDGKTLGAGGQELIDNFIASKKSELGLKSWLVWHADLLAAMLDVEPDLRTRYSAWVTEGDVLAAALAKLSRPSIQNVIPLAIKKDLKKDRDVRRKDAGQVTEKRIFVDDVFVDLPINFDDASFELEEVVFSDSEVEEFIETQNEEPDEIEDIDFEIDDDSFPRGIVDNLLRRSGDCFDPESISVTCHPKRPRPNRIVLLGGPGQGKSTIAQFIVQIFRAIVVLSDFNKLPADETKDAADAIIHRSQSEGLPIHAARRYPILIDLPKFADAAKRTSDAGGHLSILRFATEQFSKTTDYSLEPADLRSWLALYPWFLVFDGLDEVPATGNRSDVISAINEFWDDVHEVGADVTSLAHLRPQIIHVCDALDEGDLGSEDKVARAGSILALDLLNDNVAARFPQHRRSLIFRALRMLELGPKAVSGQLAAFVDPDTRQSIEQELGIRLAQGETQSAKAAWKFLIAIFNSSIANREWAECLLIDHWPQDNGLLIRIMSSLELIPEGGGLLERLRMALIEVGPVASRTFLAETSIGRRENAPNKMTEFMPLLPAASRHDELLIHIREDAGTLPNARITVIPIGQDWPKMPADLQSNPQWIEPTVAFEFQRDPNLKTLGAAISRLANSEPGKISLVDYPWPLAGVLAEANSTDDLNKLATLAHQGAFGDFADWKSAEERWREGGITFEDMSSWKDAKFVSSDIAIRGAPFPAKFVWTSRPPRRSSTKANPIGLIEIFRSLVASLPDGARRRQIANYVLRLGRDALAYDQRDILCWALAEWERSERSLLEPSLALFILSLPIDLIQSNEVVQILDSIGRRRKGYLPASAEEVQRVLRKRLVEGPDFSIGHAPWVHRFSIS
jgi:hypothetical protein